MVLVSASAKTNPSLCLLTHLCEYGEYHVNFWNKLIHVFCVPALIWSAGVLILSLPLPNAAKYLAIAVLVGPVPWAYYILLNPLLGILYAVCMGLPLLLCAGAMATPDGDVPASSVKVAVFVHVFSWWGQLHPGHLIFEGRRPRLDDGLVQAIVQAPLFVFLECLFSLGVYGQLKTQMNEGVAARLSKRKPAS